MILWTMGYKRGKIKQNPEESHKYEISEVKTIIKRLIQTN